MREIAIDKNIFFMFLNFLIMNRFLSGEREEDGGLVNQI
jgi:hypothetical protein